MKTKKAADFYEATDLYLDGNGLMSICKLCINDMYTRIFENEKDMSRTILKLCRILNVKYDEAAVDAAKAHINTFLEKDKGSPPVFGIYKNKLVSVQSISVQDRKEHSWGGAGELTFVEPDNMFKFREDGDNMEDIGHLRLFWGDGLIREQYEFLENELKEWKSSYSCSNKAEEFFLKEICLKQLELRNARTMGSEKGIDPILKSMDALLKSAALTPAQASASSSSKSMEIIGMKIKMIESKHPAEYYGEIPLFEDFDGLGKYCRNYMTRPMLNFISGNKNYDLDENDDLEILEDSGDLEIGGGDE